MMYGSVGGEEGALQAGDTARRRQRLLAGALGSVGAAACLLAVLLSGVRGWGSEQDGGPGGGAAAWGHGSAWGVLAESGTVSARPQQLGAARSSLFEPGYEANGGGGAGDLTWLAGGKILPVEWTEPEGVDYHVQVEVVMESQDPECKVFADWVLTQVVGAPGIMDIIHLSMTPFGFGKASNGDGTSPDVELGPDKKGEMHYNVTFKGGKPPEFICEHGPSECEGNVLLACTQDLYPASAQWFRVNMCIQSRTCADGEAPTADAFAHTGA